MDSSQSFDNIHAAFWRWHDSKEDEADEAFAALIAAASGFVHSFFVRAVDSRDLEDELAHEALVRIALYGRSLPREADGLKSSPSAWIRTICRNLLLDHEKKVRDNLTVPLNEEISETLITDKPGLSESDLDLMRGELFTAAMNRLELRERQVITFRIEHQMSFPEIEAVLGFGPGQAAVCFWRAVGKLVDVENLQALRKELFD